MHEIAYANDNCRVQARWKDQLIVPRGERYVGRCVETLLPPFIIIIIETKGRKGKKKKKEEEKKVGYKSWIIRYKLIVIINVLQLSFKLLNNCLILYNIMINNIE